MPQIGFKEAAALAIKYRDAYATLREKCHAAVNEWRWADGFMAPRAPQIDFASGKWKAIENKWVASKEDTGQYACHYGLDESGRIRVCQRHREYEDPEEAFSFYESSGYWILGFRLADEKQLESVDWCEVDGPRLLRSLSFSSAGSMEHVIEWRSGRIEKDTSCHWEELSLKDADNIDNAPHLPKDADRSVEEYEYDSDGTLTRVTNHQFKGDNEEPWLTEVDYQRRAKGVSLKQLLRKAEPMLAEGVHRSAKAAQIKDEVCALLVQYTGVGTDTGGFAPPVYALPASKRSEILETNDSFSAMEILWDLGELECLPGVQCFNCESPELDDLLNQVFSATMMEGSWRGYKPVRKMFQRACRELNEMNWEGVLRATDDFFVLPMDMHREMSFHTDMNACVPSGKIKVLKRRGFYFGRFKMLRTILAEAARRRAEGGED